MCFIFARYATAIITTIFFLESINWGLLNAYESRRQGVRPIIVAYIDSDNALVSDKWRSVSDFAQGHCTAMQRPGIQPATYWSQVQHPNHCAPSLLYTTLILY